MLHIAPIVYEVSDDQGGPTAVVITPTDESGILCTCSKFDGCCDHVHAVQDIFVPGLLETARQILDAEESVRRSRGGE